jgi:hypothetical protein
VPSCPTCNQRKSNKRNDIYHPFVSSFNADAKFKLVFESARFYYDKNAIRIEKNIINNQAKVESHIETFNIVNIYNEHKDIALELIQKAEMYNESYIDELMKNYEGTLFKNREDLMRLIFGGYITDKEISKRPLSKLTKDILEQLEII